ncbi:hypothetical protein ACP275_02G172400 [Erythranthe tilingii]
MENNQRDETRSDFLKCVEIDLSFYIMSFLDDPADLVRATAVSHFWRQFVIANGLAKQMCFKKFPQLSNIVAVSDASESENISVDPTEQNILERNQKVYISLIHALTKSKVSAKDCIEDAVSASSTDNYPDESVVNTLTPRDIFVRRPSYWSSKGQSNPEVPETLIYKLQDGIWVITEINIQPFEAFFQPGKPLYSAKSVRFRIGHTKNGKEIEGDVKNMPPYKPIDDLFVWTYTSPEFPMAQENRLQPFKLPEPVVCVGGYLEIELSGRVQRQEMDGLFYICVCYVRVLGQPLSPAFEINKVEPNGNMELNYYPEKLKSVMENSSVSAPTNLQQLEENILWDRIGLLEDLLRGMQDGVLPVLEDFPDLDADVDGA